MILPQQKSTEKHYNKPQIVFIGSFLFVTMLCSGNATNSVISYGPSDSIVCKQDFPQNLIESADKNEQSIKIDLSGYTKKNKEHICMKNIIISAEEMGKTSNSFQTISVGEGLNNDVDSEINFVQEHRKEHVTLHIKNVRKYIPHFEFDDAYEEI